MLEIVSSNSSSIVLERNVFFPSYFRYTEYSQGGIELNVPFLMYYVCMDVFI